MVLDDGRKVRAVAVSPDTIGEIEAVAEALRLSPGDVVRMALVRGMESTRRAHGLEVKNQGG
jgi:protein involved in polysaccharide export with SLBB domain